MIVRFATLCDYCERRSEEYTSWPRCEDCGNDVCPDHQVPSSDTEDERNACLCLECQKERQT